MSKNKQSLREKINMTGRFKRTEEMNRKMSLSTMGHVVSEETRKKIGDANRGRPLSEETKRKLSIAHTGKTLNEEHRRKIGLARKGHEVSLEARRIIGEKNSIALKGRVMYKMTPEIRKKISEGHKGDKAWNWKGGITPESIKIRTKYEYKLWKKKVLERDVNCVLCGSTREEKILHVDHIKSFALYPELRHDLSNGRVLCIDCHRKTDTFGIKGGFPLSEVKQSLERVFK